MRISERLKTIGEVVHKGASVIDVGADHGLLEKYLLDSGKVTRILAVENKKGPYETLKNNLKGYDVEILLSDGLNDLPDDINTVVLAGMGGNLIVDILKRDPNKLTQIDQIVVDAHRDAELVRREVTGFGYKIEKEQIVLENGIYYFIMSFVKGNSSYKDIDFEFGININRDPLFNAYKCHELERLGITLGFQKKSSIATKEEIQATQSKIERLSNL